MDSDETSVQLWPVVHHTAFPILGSRAEAEDIAQEAMIKAVSRCRGVVGHARPWAGHMAADHAIDVPHRRDCRSSFATAEGATLSRPPRRQRDVPAPYLHDLEMTEAAVEFGLSVAAARSRAHRPSLPCAPTTGSFQWQYAGRRSRMFEEQHDV